MNEDILIRKRSHSESELRVISCPTVMDDISQVDPPLKRPRRSPSLSLSACTVHNLFQLRLLRVDVISKMSDLSAARLRERGPRDRWRGCVVAQAGSAWDPKLGRGYSTTKLQMLPRGMCGM